MNSRLASNTMETGESLARFAEIADVVSRQHQTAALARSVVAPPPTSHFSAVSAALRKRALDSQSLSTETVRDAKRNKTEESSGNVRFREYQAEIWSEKFEDLCEFRRFYGHCHVPHTYERNAPLAQWVKRQRYQYKLKLEGKRSTLSDERVRLLNKIGFIWNSHDAVWEERWNELLQYKRLHGHCVVPSNYEKNPQLAVWVKRQRRQYKFYCEDKPTSMTPERITKLEKLGFAWDCRKSKGDEDVSPGLKASISPPTPPPTPPPVAKATPEPAAAARTEASIKATAALGMVSQQPGVPGVAYPKSEFFTFSRQF
jgi:hypothetical protein